MPTKNEKSKAETLEEKYVLEENDPEYSYEYVTTHENAAIKKYKENSDNITESQRVEISTRIYEN
jgi:hypothetical protein